MVEFTSSDEPGTASSKVEGCTPVQAVKSASGRYMRLSSAPPVRSSPARVNRNDCPPNERLLASASELSDAAARSPTRAAPEALGQFVTDHHPLSRRAASKSVPA